VVRPKPSGLVASPSWARPSVVAGGSTCALKRALVQAGIEAKSARAVSSLLVRTAGDGGCSAPAATRGGRRPLFCGGEPRSSEAFDGTLAQSDSCPAIGFVSKCQNLPGLEPLNCEGNGLASAYFQSTSITKSGEPYRAHSRSDRQELVLMKGEPRGCIWLGRFNHVV
jgi:hypothetical protein